MKSTVNNLIEDNMGLVGYTIKRRNLSSVIEKYKCLSYEDLYQEGCYALCKAAASYDEGKGKFTTFAVTCISNHITNYLRDTIGGEKGEFLENAYSLDEERDDNSSFLDNAPADDKSFEAIRYLELKNELLEIAKKGGKELLEAANIFILCAEDGISLRSYCKKLGLSYNRLYYHKMILKNLVCQAEAC